MESGAVTNKPVSFSWDGDIPASVNGHPYEKNAGITADGVYVFLVTDFAGNQSEEYRIEIDTAAPRYNREQLDSDTSYPVSRWYVVEFNDAKKAFASYESALAYACGLEFTGYVAVLELKDVNDFTQLHLVASNGNPAQEVRTGIY